MVVTVVPHGRLHSLAILLDPKDMLLVPFFNVAITVGQFVRFKALITPHRIGVWAARTGEYDARELMQYVSDTSTQVIERALKCHPNWKRW
jgi:hypothetical protein